MNDLFNFQHKECNCCHRHFGKRPKFMYKGWTMKFIKIVKYQKMYKCNCRQNMRMLAQNMITMVRKNINISLTTNNNYVID